MEQSSDSGFPCFYTEWLCRFTLSFQRNMLLPSSGLKE